MRDLNLREVVVARAAGAAAAWSSGFFPRPLLDDHQPRRRPTPCSRSARRIPRPPYPPSRDRRRTGDCQVTLAATFSKPTIEYGLLSPLLVVLGVAVLGVLVEAFVAAPLALPRAGGAGAGRHRRRPGRHRAGRPAPHPATPVAAASWPSRARSPSTGPPSSCGARSSSLSIDQRAAVRRAHPRGRGHRLRRPGRGAARHRGRAGGLHPAASSTPRSSR